MPDPSAIERHLAAARASLRRVAVERFADVLAAGALVVDIRPEADRRAEGELDGAVVIERVHLEWRLDPTSPDRIAEAVPGRRVVIVCNEGYSSVLAATSLVALGVDATDLDGGYRALVAIGSPLVRSGTT
jgi:rhodanese-related sulfurtransferase